MRRVLKIRDEPSPPLRVMLIDSNAVFRAACRALLRTEGVDVVADLARGHAAIELVHRLRPDVVLVEATDRAPRGHEIAGLICSLPDAPSVLLISTDDRSQLAAAIGSRGHLAKADICAEAIASATATPSSPTTQTPSSRRLSRATERKGDQHEMAPRASAPGACGPLRIGAVKPKPGQLDAR